MLAPQQRADCKLQASQLPRLRTLCSQAAPSTHLRTVCSQAAPSTRRTVSEGQGRKTERIDAQRLSKILAAAGVASRRAAEDIIFAGRVLVNGQKELLPQRKVVPGKDKISLDGKLLALQKPKKVYFALNKPKGYICSNSSSDNAQHTPRLAVDLLSSWVQRQRNKESQSSLPPRLFTVGRLDVQSTGLILVTNDGPWANQVSHPSYGVTKEYVVTTNQPANKKQLKDLEQGCTIEGVEVKPVGIAVEMSDPSKRNKLRIVIAEGKNREVRQLVSHVGLEVTYLKRVRVGGFRLPKELGIGQFQELKPHEVRRVTDAGAQSNPYL